MGVSSVYIYYGVKVDLEPVFANCNYNYPDHLMKDDEGNLDHSECQVNVGEWSTKDSICLSPEPVLYQGQNVVVQDFPLEFFPIPHDMGDDQVYLGFRIATIGGWESDPTNQLEAWANWAMEDHGLFKIKIEEACIGLGLSFDENNLRLRGIKDDCRCCS